MVVKSQRVRDPLHNLVEFDRTQLHQTLWRIIQTQPFQRLRRIRQLGFSELVYPGATHTRFAHSIGAFHTAQRLMQIIIQHVKSTNGQVKENQAKIALVAALVHDVGHGMFSHAFEDVGRRMKLKMAEHEHVSDLLIREGEISQVITAELGSGVASDVADVISRGRPGNLYDAVVSSQFDADRLDYMQRDRLMTGVQNSGIDFVWLMNNLEVGEVAYGADDEQSGTIDTFVLGPKALHAAETYVTALFQLYPTVYFHKATRGAEKIFSQIMLRVFDLVRKDQIALTGLGINHPIVRFALNPESITNALALDDTVFWGALPMLQDAKDPLISAFSSRLWQRKLLKCIDVHQEVIGCVGLRRGSTATEINKARKKIERISISIQEAFQEYTNIAANFSRLLIDQADRHPYRRFQESKGPLNQINIRQGENIFDIAEVSPMVASLEPFIVFRVYFDSNDVEVKNFVEQTIQQKLKGKL